ncbi:endonuclease/exonuclease/phosphatase family protein [uncultured Parabacteroides sp.]|uniref:endonuclease/exonuclease/phosphatase family protein n=1 Tax=uncultured Parabacteroides sp. TaxID=512312 RepID=UPI00258B86A8|nr:endonuclease/exonuclease/phosphatase family protein [uncultured Parabacteroides sp.]
MKTLKTLGLLLLFSLFALKGISQEKETNTIKVISYNIWNGFEKDAARQARFTEWINQQKPDIVALEELVGINEKDLSALAASYGHPYVAIVKEEGYPVGLTSRKPIDVVKKQVEGFWHGMLHAQTYGLDIIVTHLSPFEWKYRLKEAEAITEYIRENKLESCMVMGDFNAYSPFDADEVETHTQLRQNMQGWDKSHPEYGNMRGEQFDYSVLSKFLSIGFADPVKMFVPAEQRMSYPAATLYEWQWGDPRLKMLGERLDYILVSPALAPKCLGATVHNGEELEGISDHYPVSIRMELPQ